MLTVCCRRCRCHAGHRHLLRRWTLIGHYRFVENWPAGHRMSFHNALPHSESSQANRSASRFQRGGLAGRIFGSTCSSAFRRRGSDP
jgi:hypothetical protein